MSEEIKQEIPSTEAELEMEESTAEETTAEQTAPQEESGDPVVELQAVKAQLEAAEKQNQDTKDQMLRIAAEYDNFRKRAGREKDAAFNNGVSFAVNQILSILDTLEMAANAPTEDENYKKGVLMTLDKAQQAFQVLKVEEIPAMGQPFDPELHSAVMQQPAQEGQESGTVVQVFQKGYKLDDKVVRHATVVVAE